MFYSAGFFSSSEISLSSSGVSCGFGFSNVFVSSSGSCYVSNSLGIPTIPIDSNDHKPIGVLDRTTKNVIYRDYEPQVELKKLLDDILIKRIYKPEVVVNRDEFKVDFSEHLIFISDSNNISPSSLPP